MRICSLGISGYRSFGPDPIVIDLPEGTRPVSIIGHNNSGKSNLINAIAYCLGARPFTTASASMNDIFMQDPTGDAVIDVTLDPALETADAFNTIHRMPIVRLALEVDEGTVRVTHQCCSADGKPVYTPQSVKRSKTKPITPEEAAVLNARTQSGAEFYYRHRKKVPVYFVSPQTLFRELSVNKYSLIGKAIEAIKAGFLDPGNVLPDEDGIRAAHRGRPRLEIYQQALQYLQDHVLPTEEYRQLVGAVEGVLKEQLDVDGDSFSVLLSPGLSRNLCKRP